MSKAHKEYVLGAFLDISRAFNNVFNNGIVNSLEADRIELAIIAWTKALLNCRTQWNGTKPAVWLTTNPQRGVL